MTTLTENDVSRIAKLAKLELADTQRVTILQDLNNILALVNQLQAVDTSDVEPLYHPLSLLKDMPLRLRDDVVTEPNTVDVREQMMSNAPARQDGLFLVPKVIE